MTAGSPSAPAATQFAVEPLATILGRQIAGVTFMAARAEAQLAFDRHPAVASRPMAPGGSVSLMQVATAASCDPIHDTASFDTNNDHCIVNFQAMWIAYGATGDTQFRVAAIDLYSALRAQLPGTLVARLDAEIRILSHYLITVPPATP
jgi:hypothetical protein